MNENYIEPPVEEQPFRPQTIHAIINPAAGTEQPVLRILNRILKQRGIKWEGFITQDAGDAQRYAQESAEAGVDVVLACGGDGTVREVASGLRGSEVPLAILPCGTANVMAVELGIPRVLEQAVVMLTDGETILREVDMGKINEQEFLLRVGTGMEAQMILNTPRESKNRIGNLAYVLTGLSEIGTMELTQYRLTLDGLKVEVEGISLWIANSMNVGLPGIRLVQDVDISDGLLDTVLLRRANLPAMIAIASGALFNRTEKTEPIVHWQAREIRVETDPPRPVQVDGEEFPQPPFTAHVIPKAIKIVSPSPRLLTRNGETPAGFNTE